MTLKTAAIAGVRAGVVSAAAFCFLAISAEAQIGRGWTEYFPTKTLQQENSIGYSSYTDVDGVETFILRKNPSGARQRCEIRINDDYTTGTTQFQGEFFMPSGSGGGGTSTGESVSVMQVWLSLIVAISDRDGGSIWYQGKSILDHAYGRWVRLNVYHDANRKQVEIWFDGVKRGAGSSKASNPYYHKFGLYHSLVPVETIQWRKVRFFRGGGMEGGSSATQSAPPGINPARGNQLWLFPSSAPSSVLARMPAGSGGGAFFDLKGVRIVPRANPAAIR